MLLYFTVSVIGEDVPKSKPLRHDQMITKWPLLVFLLTWFPIAPKSFSVGGRYLSALSFPAP